MTYFDIGRIKNTTRPGNGIIQISGIEFSIVDGFWVSNLCPDLTITIKYSESIKRCVLSDHRDRSSYDFGTVFAAKTFAKRRKHSRTLEEHLRAEALLLFKERNGLSLKETAEEIGVSPRTLEAYFSGARAVPLGKI